EMVVPPLYSQETVQPSMAVSEVLVMRIAPVKPASHSLVITCSHCANALPSSLLELELDELLAIIELLVIELLEVGILLETTELLTLDELLDELNELLELTELLEEISELLTLEELVGGGNGELPPPKATSIQPW